ncbi:MAG: flagellar export protein FliJ [Ignavibacteriales bacterium]
MKRFRFRLERVLRAKEAIQTVRQVELAGARARLDAEEGVLASILGLLDESERRYRDVATGGIDPWRMSCAAGYLKHLDGQAEVQELKVERSRDEVEICRQRVIEARQDTKVLENLRARRRSEHVAAFLKEEQGLLDEVGGVRYASKTGPGTPAVMAG